MSVALRARTAPLGSAFDLLAAYREPDGFFLERSRMGVAASGASARVVVPAGPQQVARAGSVVRAAFASIGAFDAAVPVATGALPFDGSRDAVLTIPERVVLRADDESTRQIVVDRPGGDIAVAPERWAARASPLAPFVEMQLHLEPDPARYARTVRIAAERVRSGSLRKVVLARTLVVDADRSLSPKKLLWRLRAVDPECYTFAVPIVPNGVLVGATPELLVSRRGSIVRSNPLAGSAPRAGDADEDRASADRLWHSAKEREEHAVVVEAVAEVLAPMCEELSFDPDPELLATANVWHLSTPFEGRLREPAPNALRILAELHPTPAVAGAPRDEALRTIAELESIDRGCYAGPVGWIDANGDGEWAIALRCAEIDGPAARLFAGAGIVADSDPEAEVAETDAKFRALLDALRWG